MRFTPGYDIAGFQPCCNRRTTLPLLNASGLPLLLLMTQTEERFGPPVQTPSYEN
jgi:hypothetical protein